jgi:hypothetical protein
LAYEERLIPFQADGAFILSDAESTLLVSDVNSVVGVNPQREPILVHNAAIFVGFSLEFRSSATPIR